MQHRGLPSPPALSKRCSPPLHNLDSVLEMSRKRGTPCRGSNGQGKTICNLCLLVEEGYEAKISMSVFSLINDYVARLFNENIAIHSGGGKINHYWLIKNMMGTLMEDMLSIWSSPSSTVLSVKAKLIDLDDQLNGLDATFSWKHLASRHRRASNT